MKEIHSIEFFLNNPDFVKWVNSSDEALRQRWLEFVSENPQSRHNLIQAREIIQSFRLAGERPSSQSKHEVLNRIIERIDEKDSSEKKRNDSVFWKNRFLRSAALITLLFLSFLSVFYFVDKGIFSSGLQEATPKFIRKSPLGSKLKSKLPDGTIVWLNAESEIEYEELADPKSRIVHLSGEAFFQVKHDSNRLFKVKTNKCSVIALGTSFNVSSYLDNAFTSVALATGKVQVTNLEDNNQLIELKPGEKAVLMKDGDEFQINIFELEEEFGWKEGVLVFNKASYPQIERRLERWFGVNISAEEGIIDNWKVTARFENKSLERILKHLSYTKKFDFIIENENVRISNINDQTMPMDKKPPDQ